MSLTKKKDLLHFFPLTIWPSETFHLPSVPVQSAEGQGSLALFGCQIPWRHSLCSALNYHAYTHTVRVFPLPSFDIDRSFLPVLRHEISNEWCEGSELRTKRRKEAHPTTPIFGLAKKFFFLSGGGTKESERGKR